MSLEQTLSFSPLTTEERTPLSEKDYQEFIHKKPFYGVVHLLAVDPFETALKEKMGVGRHTFGDITVGVSERSQTKTSWKDVLQDLEGFMEQRADDSKVEESEALGIRRFEGIGFCIQAKTAHEQVEKYIEDHTKTSKYLQADWPRAKKDDAPVRSLMIRHDDFAFYSQLDGHTAREVLEVRRFRSALKKEVLDAYKNINKAWHKLRTGYDDGENIPPEDRSPVRRIHMLDSGLVLVRLVTEPTPQYKEIVQLFSSVVGHAAKAKERGTEGIRGTLDDDGESYLSIKSLRYYLTEKREAPQHNILKARYDIQPN